MLVQNIGQWSIVVCGNVFDNFNYLHLKARKKTQRSKLLLRERPVMPKDTEKEMANLILFIHVNNAPKHKMRETIYERERVDRKRARNFRELSEFRFQKNGTPLLNMNRKTISTKESRTARMIRGVMSFCGIYSRHDFLQINGSRDASFQHLAR